MKNTLMELNELELAKVNGGGYVYEEDIGYENEAYNENVNQFQHDWI